MYGTPPAFIKSLLLYEFATNVRHKRAYRRSEFAVCSIPARVDSLRSIWTYHEQVGLVMEDDYCGVYFLIEGIKEEGWRLRKIDGILT